MIGKKLNGKFFLTTSQTAQGRSDITQMYEMILGDTIARYRRISDYAVSYMNCSLSKANDEQVKRTWKRFSISCDRPVNVFDQGNHAAIRNIFRKLLNQDDIYHTADGVFVFRAQKYQDRVMTWYKNYNISVQPENAKQFLKNEIQENGLSDIAVSTVVSDYGVSVPENDNLFISAWFCDVCSYLTGIGYDPDGSSDSFFTYWPANLQIIPYSEALLHAAYWPAILFALNLPLPGCIFIHPELHWEGSDSETADSLADKYTVDGIRYCSLLTMKSDEDCSLSEEKIRSLYNKDLVCMLSLLIEKSVSAANNYFPNGVYDRSVFNNENEDNDLKIFISKMSSELRNEMSVYHVSSGLDVIFDLYRTLNNYLEKSYPEQIIDLDSDKDRFETILYNLLDGIQSASSVIGAFLVETCDKILEQINSPELNCYELHHTGNFVSGNKVADHPSVLFTKL